MVKIVNDNYMYAKLVKFVKDKKSLTSDSLEEISEITGDEDKAREVLEAAKASMGRILRSKAKAKGLVFLMLDFLFSLESKSWRDKGPESLYVRCVQAKIFHQWI
jgi:glycogen debranching enzyme